MHQHYQTLSLIKKMIDFFLREIFSLLMSITTHKCYLLTYCARRQPAGSTNAGQYATLLHLCSSPNAQDDLPIISQVQVACWTLRH